MPPRQQRTDNARGGLPFRTIATSADYQWSVTGVTTTSATITVAGIGTGVSLNGIPQMRCNETGEYPATAAFTSTGFVLGYVSEMPVGATFTIQARDAAYRGPQGQYLATGTQRAPSPPSQPTVRNFGPSSSLPINTVNIPDMDGLTTSLDNGSVNGDWIIVVNPAFALSDCAVSYTSGSTNVTPGQVALFIWNGAGWLLD